LNRFGMTESTKATPPVDIVEAYQAKVKCFNRSDQQKFWGMGFDLWWSSSATAEFTMSFSFSDLLSSYENGLSHDTIIGREIEGGGLYAMCTEVLG